jgi:hypothetical protein
MLLNEFVAVMQPAPANQQQQQQQQQDAQQPQAQPAQRLVLLPEANVKDSMGGTTSFVDLRTRTGFSALHYATFWGFQGKQYSTSTPLVGGVGVRLGGHAQISRLGAHQKCMIGTVMHSFTPSYLPLLLSQQHIGAVGADSALIVWSLPSQ